MKFKFVILSLILGSASASHAQNEDDALRLSMTYFGGTARNMGTAGGLTALGADYSNAAQNPAGLGRLTKSNLSFTGNLEIPMVTTSFNGAQSRSSRITGNISNISYVKAYSLDPNKFNNWYSVQIGLGMNRIKSFNDSIRYEGVSDSSILHSFINEAWGTPESEIYNWHPFTASLAYDTYAIDPGTNSGEYVTQFQYGPALHKRKLRRRGGLTEYNLMTVSGNYANKLLVGASFNVIHTRYTEFMRHEEVFPDTANWLHGINYSGELDITGWGINARIGAIYMPIDELRLGLAIETPTQHWMSDEWTNTMNSDTENGNIQVANEFVPTGAYKYKIRTPFKTNFSAAYVSEKYGSIGAEVEFVDYRGAKLDDRKFSSAPYSFAAENGQIDNIYKSVLNYKIGLEARVNKQLYLRGGFAYYGNPYKSASGNFQNPTLFFTGGAGYNFGPVYLDLAYVLQSRQEEYFAYDPTIGGSRAEFDIKNSQVLLTIGARFNN